MRCIADHCMSQSHLSLSRARSYPMSDSVSVSPPPCASRLSAQRQLPSHMRWRHRAACVRAYVRSNTGASLTLPRPVCADFVPL